MQSKMQFIRITIARLKRQSELQNSNYSTYEWTFRACVLSDLHATIVTDLHLNHIRKLAVHGAGQWTHFVYWMTMTHMKRAIELCYTECFGLTNKPVKIVFPITSFLFGFCRQHTLWFAHVCAPGLELFIIANATSQYCTSMFDSV